MSAGQQNMKNVDSCACSTQIHVLNMGQVCKFASAYIYLEYTLINKNDNGDDANGYSGPRIFDRSCPPLSLISIA